MSRMMISSAPLRTARHSSRSSFSRASSSSSAMTTPIRAMTNRGLCNIQTTKHVQRRRIIESLAQTNRKQQQRLQVRYSTSSSGGQRILSDRRTVAAATIGTAAAFVAAAYMAYPSPLNAINITNMEAYGSTNSSKFTTKENTKSSNDYTAKKIPPTKTLECDFAIVGYGNAGRSALRTLTSLNPKLKIVVIDPHHLPNSSHQKGQKSNVIHVPFSRALALHHSSKTLHCTSSSTNGEEEGEMVKIKYTHSMLISTGCRGSPLPMSLVDTSALSRVLELRGTTANNMKNEEQQIMLSPEMVRSITLMAAASSSDSKSNICILGSGLEALELACAANDRRNNSNGKGKKKKKKDDSSSSKVVLLFGNAGPLSDKVPRYLSSAITKRLKLMGVDVHERSLVRYISSFSKESQKNGGGLEIHASKSYDNLDTCRLSADLLIVAPSVEGHRGTAVVPIDTNSIHRVHFNNDDDSSNNNNSNKLDEYPCIPSFSSSYQPWSNLLHPTDNSVLSCYDKDGRIVVNNELNAASDLFAAGSVARYPDNSTGQSAVAGEGVTNGNKAGEIAAHNMYRAAFGGLEQKSQMSSRIYATESLPIWRTDICSYISPPKAPGNIKNNDRGGSLYTNSYTLASMGVHAFCVGRCDSNDMATHGFWWTNQASDVRRIRSSANGDISRRLTSKVTASKRPVYGSGVLFYLDRDGIIRGIMTWGLPFTRTDGSGEETPKEELVKRMKDLLRTNGRIATIEHKSRISDPIVAEVDKLSSLHLAEESKYLASLAYDKTVDVDAMSKPLHRYVPSKPSSVAGMGVLKRRNSVGNGSGGGILEDDIFARRDDGLDTDDILGGAESERPQSLVHVYPMNPYFSFDRDDPFSQYSSGSSYTGTDNGMHSNSLQKAEESQDNFRSRPSKEEPLWLRRGDAERYTSMSDAMTENFLQNMRKGKLADGSDAFRGAPTPQVVQDAKELLRQWSSSVDQEEEDFSTDGHEGEDFQEGRR